MSIHPENEYHIPCLSVFNKTPLLLSYFGSNSVLKEEKTKYQKCYFVIFSVLESTDSYTNIDKVLASAVYIIYEVYIYSCIYITINA